jgi:flagellar basal body-associated protein FliL
MADKPQTPPAAAAPATPAAPPAPAKSASPLKAVILVVAVLVIEAGTILGTMWFTAGPAQVKGEGIATDMEAEQNTLTEQLVLKDKFTNDRTGRTYVYDTEIYVTVKKKHLDKFKEELDLMQQRIRSDVDTIFRKAEPAAFQEPTRATLTRQIKAALDSRFGNAPDGEPFIQDVLIGKCMPFRTDY